MVLDPSIKSVNRHFTVVHLSMFDIFFFFFTTIVFSIFANERRFRIKKNIPYPHADF